MKQRFHKTNQHLLPFKAVVRYCGSSRAHNTAVTKYFQTEDEAWQFLLNARSKAITRAFDDRNLEVQQLDNIGFRVASSSQIVIGQVFLNNQQI